MSLPSESALRVLRHFALGTSCTLVFAVGITIEDHRRLMLTAQKIRRNSRIIKSSKRYTTAGANAIKAFEDKALSCQDEDTTENGLSLGHISKTSNNITVRSFTTETLGEEESGLPSVDSSTETKSPHMKIPVQLNGMSIKQGKTHSDQFGLSTVNDADVITKLEHCVISHLQSFPPQPIHAATLFIDILTEGMRSNRSSIKTIKDRRLLSLALLIFRACKRESKFDFAGRVFGEVIKRGIEEKIFIPFQLERIIQNLTNRRGLCSLEEVVAIYFTTLENYAEHFSSQLFSVCRKLCEITFTLEKYHLTKKIVNRTQQCCGKFPLDSLGYFIMSVAYEEEYRPEVFDYFVRYYHLTVPQEGYHNKIVKNTVNYLLANRKFDEAEQIIIEASKTAQKLGYSHSAIPCLNLIQENWVVLQDLDKTMALFTRFENYIQNVKCSFVFYDLMAKICIQAEDIISAQSILNRSPSGNGSRKFKSLLTQFTLFKAEKGHWKAVEDDFKKIDQTKTADQYTKIFPRILKIFANNNDISKIEQFIGLAFKMGIYLNTDSINKIAEIYAKERNFEAITSLLHYMSKNGFTVDPVFIALILKHFYDSWRFKIDQCFFFIEEIIKINSSNPPININTFLLLRRIIISKTRLSISRRMEALERLDKIFEPYHLEKKDPYNPKHLLWEMVAALNFNDPAETLEIYNWARSKNISLRAEHLNVAVEASFRCSNGSIDEGVKIVQASGLLEAQTAESMALLFGHQLKQLIESRKTNSDEIVNMTEMFISKFEKRGFKVPIQVIIQTISSLERLYQFSTLGTFWKSVSDRLNITQSRLDLATLTVFLSTYIKLKDVDGFWQIVQIMIQNRIVPDHHCRNLLKNARRRLSLDLRLRRGSFSQNNLFLKAILKGCYILNQIRSKARHEREVGIAKLIQMVDKNLQPHTSVNKRLHNFVGLR